MKEPKAQAVDQHKDAYNDLNELESLKKVADHLENLLNDDNKPPVLN